MLVTFEKEYLRELYEKGQASDKKHRYQPQIVRKYAHVVDFTIKKSRHYGTHRRRRRQNDSQQP